jgi:hypothetical protein
MLRGYDVRILLGMNEGDVSHSSVLLIKRVLQYVLFLWFLVELEGVDVLCPLSFFLPSLVVVLPLCLLISGSVASS